jgi:hypothetical protein
MSDGRGPAERSHLGLDTVHKFLSDLCISCEACRPPLPNRKLDDRVTTFYGMQSSPW